MLPSKLLQILAKNKELFRPFSEVLVELRNQGWREDTLADAEVWYQNYQPPMTPWMRAIKRKKELLKSYSSDKKHIPAKFFSPEPKKEELKEAKREEVKEIKKVEALKPEKEVLIPETAQSISKKKTGEEIIDRLHPPYAILAAGLAILIAVFFTAAASIAYGKINLGNKDIQHKIRNAIQGLPLAPKTADYLIDRAVESDKNIKSSYIKASIESKELAGMLGVESLNLSVNGPIDLFDPQNPKISLNLKAGDDFESDFMVINNVFYFRLSRVSEGILEYLKLAGFPVLILETDRSLNKWYSYKIAPKQNEAGDFANESNGTFYFSNKLREFLGDDLVSKFTVDKSEAEGRSSYELTLNLSNRDLQNLLLSSEGRQQFLIPGAVSQADSYISTAVIKVWIDSKNYYTRKAVVSVTIDNARLNSNSLVLGDKDLADSAGIFSLPENLPSDQVASPALNNVAIVFSFELSRFNEQFAIEVPEKALSYENLMIELAELSADSNRFIPEILKPYVWQIDENDSKGIVPLPK